MSAEATQDSPVTVWRVRTTWGLRLLALVYGLLIVGAGVVISNNRTLHRYAIELTSLHAEVNDLILREATLRTEMQQRVDLLEQTLFGDVLAKLEKQTRVKTPRIEPWRLNRDRELSARISRLEEWRLRVER